MNPKTCGAHAIVVHALLSNVLPSHTTHTCVRTDLDDTGDHLGLHTCACGQDFLVLPQQPEAEAPTPEQPDAWAEAVHERLRKLERGHVIHSGRIAQLLDATALLGAIDGTTIDLVQDLDHRVSSHSGSIAALERKVDDYGPMTAGQAVDYGASSAASRILATVEETMMEGAPRVVVIRQFVLELLHTARGHAIDVDPESDVATPGQSAAQCQECRAEVDQRIRLYAQRRAEAIQRPDPAERFWRLFDGDRLTAAQAGERIASAGVTEIRAGAPATIVVKYMLAEAIHVQDGHPASQRGRACSQCLSAAGRLLELRQPSALERLRLLEDMTVQYLGTPAPCSRIHQEVATADDSRLCGTCGARVGLHPNWANQPTLEAVRDQVARGSDEDRFCGATFDHPPHLHQVDGGGWACPGVDVAHDGGTVHIEDRRQPRRPFAEAVQRIADRARAHGADVNVTWNGPGQARVSVSGASRDQISDALAEVAAPVEDKPTEALEDLLGGPDEEHPF